jgi:2'-hydroxyisoflavone reductase
MQFNRRDALKIAGGATLATLFDSALAKAKSLKVLILGGTGFIGPHFVDALTAGGHKITLFNRGKRDPEVKPGIEQLLGDRNGQIDALKGRDWDVVIDNSGYTPSQVKATAELLKDHVKRYIFISSIAVYADFAKAGVDETTSSPSSRTDHRRGDRRDLRRTQGALREGGRGHLRQARHHHPAYLHRRPWRSHRPVHLLAGPRLQGRRDARAGYAERSVPVHRRARPRGLHPDLRGERRGRQVQLCGPQGAVTMGSLLDESKRITRADTRFVWVSPEFLEANEIIGEKAKGNYIPSGSRRRASRPGCC